MAVNAWKEFTMNEDTTSQNVIYKEQGKTGTPANKKCLRRQRLKEWTVMPCLVSSRRIGKEQSEKNQYKDEKRPIEGPDQELEGSTIKRSRQEPFDDDKSRGRMAAMTSRFKSCNQLNHNKAVKETMAAFKYSGPSDEIVEMVVTGDDEQIYANTKAIWI